MSKRTPRSRWLVTMGIAKAYHVIARTPGHAARLAFRLDIHTRLAAVAKIKDVDDRRKAMKGINQPRTDERRLWEGVSLECLGPAA